MEKIIRKIAILSILLIFLSFNHTNSEETYSLTIKVEGLRNSKGVVQFALYNKDGSIPDEKFENYYKKEIAVFAKGSSSVTFYKVPKGRYAVCVLHDENENGKIDKKFILPIEGVGFSNYEFIGLTNRPTFSKASFQMDTSMTKVVKIIYK
ncbi:MAG: DUF2141 domain-containing protein [Flavobacteriaceae bacterium]|nr:DUF2141 domain-containing protein [Flavobacteriaceae bacterium]